MIRLPQSTNNRQKRFQWPLLAALPILMIAGCESSPPAKKAPSKPRKISAKPQTKNAVAKIDSGPATPITEQEAVQIRGLVARYYSSAAALQFDDVRTLLDPAVLPLLDFEVAVYCFGVAHGPKTKNRRPGLVLILQKSGLKDDDLLLIEKFAAAPKLMKSLSMERLKVWQSHLSNPDQFNAELSQWLQSIYQPGPAMTADELKTAKMSSVSALEFWRMIPDKVQSRLNQSRYLGQRRRFFVVNVNGREALISADKTRFYVVVKPR